MTTFHSSPRSREAGLRNGLTRGIGAQLAAVLMAVLVASPPHVTRDTTSASAPAPVRSATPEPRA